MPALHLERYAKRFGKPCPRIEPLPIHRPVINCAHELMATPEMTEQVWEDWTHDMPRATRRAFRRRVAIYRGEIRTALRESQQNNKPPADKKTATPPRARKAVAKSRVKRPR